MMRPERTVPALLLLNKLSIGFFSPSRQRPFPWTVLLSTAPILQRQRALHYVLEKRSILPAARGIAQKIVMLSLYHGVDGESNLLEGEEGKRQIGSFRI